MPKVRATNSELLTKYTTEFPCLRAAAGKLVCNLCEDIVSYSKKFQVTQHMDSAKHRRKASLRDSGTWNPTPPISTTFTRELDYAKDIAEMFTSANIPLNKLNNPHVSRFLAKWTNNPTPSEASIRLKYVPNLFNTKLLELKRSLALKKKWISVDETTDSLGRYVANAVVGTFDSEDTKVYLVNMEILESVNHSTVARFIKNSIEKISSNPDDFLACITDGAAYMKKGLEGLQVLMPKLIHVTCLAHAMHRVCEKIREKNEHIDRLVTAVKKILIKPPCEETS